MVIPDDNLEQDDAEGVEKWQQVLKWSMGIRQTV
jgi:hypothetical protein